MQPKLPSIDSSLLQKLYENKGMNQDDNEKILSMLCAFHNYAVSYTLAPQQLYVKSLHPEQIWEQLESNYMDIADMAEEDGNSVELLSDEESEVIEEIDEVSSDETTLESTQEEDLWQVNMTEAQARSIEAELRAADDQDGDEEEEEEEEENPITSTQYDDLLEKEPVLKHKEHPKQTVYSDFELARLRLQATIKNIENDMMNRPTWDMAGEISAHQRPADALLRKIDELDFEIKQRPRIQLSDELNENIEKLISIRCRDELFDDPVYFTSEGKTQKKEIVISDAKSHKALGDDIKDSGIDKVRAMRDGELSSGIGNMGEKHSGNAAITGSTATNDAIRAKEDECYTFFAELERDLHAYTSFFSVSVK